MDAGAVSGSEDLTPYAAKRPALRGAHVAPVSGLHRGRSTDHGPYHRRQHRHLQRGERGDAAAAALRRARPAAARRGEERETQPAVFWRLRAELFVVEGTDPKHGPRGPGV